VEVGFFDYTSLSSTSYLSLGFFDYLSTHPATLRALLGESEHLENRHMRPLLRNVLLPMLKHCPPSLLPALLRPVLPQLLTQLLRRLECGYTAVGEGGTVERHTVHATIHAALEAFLGANTLAVVRCLFALFVFASCSSPLPVFRCSLCPQEKGFRARKS
jgi:hypothetical protein